MQITMQGKYQTRDGREAKVLAIDRVTRPPMQDLPVVGLYRTDDGSEHLCCWSFEGFYGASMGCLNPNLDLVPVPKKHQGWLAIDKDGIVALSPGVIYDSRGDVLRLYGKFVTVGRVEWED